MSMCVSAPPLTVHVALVRVRVLNEVLLPIACNPRACVQMMCLNQQSLDTHTHTHTHNLKRKRFSDCVDLEEDEM